jgi:uncharacterized protein (TIGR02147 family)
MALTVNTQPPTHRPDVFSYQDTSAFVRDMLLWKKQAEPTFSVRREVQDLRRCSPALVTLVASGQRNLSPDRVAEFSKLLGLSSAESRMLFVLSGGKEGHKPEPTLPILRQKQNVKRSGVRSGLFQPWFHLHLWEASRLPCFRADALSLFQLLRGIATPTALGKSVRYLLREGFLRRTLDGRIVPDCPTLETTDEIPSEHIRKLHVRSLQLAARLTGELPVKEREAGMVLMSLNEEGFQKLKSLIKNFNESLTQFSEENASQGNCLYQVVVNAVPVSVRPQGEQKS